MTVSSHVTLDLLLTASHTCRDLARDVWYLLVTKPFSQRGGRSGWRAIRFHVDEREARLEGRTSDYPELLVTSCLRYLLVLGTACIVHVICNLEEVKCPAMRRRSKRGRHSTWRGPLRWFATLNHNKSSNVPPPSFLYANDFATVDLGRDRLFCARTRLSLRHM